MKKILAKLNTKLLANEILVFSSIILVVILFICSLMIYYHLFDENIAEFSDFTLASEPKVGEKITYKIEVIKHKPYTGTVKRTLQCYNESGNYLPVTLQEGNASSSTGVFHSKVNLESTIPEDVKGYNCQLVVNITYKQRLGAEQTYNLKTENFIIK